MALKHSHKYETLSACACTVDNIAEQMTYDEFVQADSYVRMRNMRGEKGGLFRGSDQAREIRKQFSEIKREAEAACFINQVQQESSSETPDSTISASSNIRKG